MCGRYYIPPEDDDTGFHVILEQVKNKCKDSAFLSGMKLGEIFPTEIVPVVTGEAPVLMKWGFSRFDGKGQVINARLETATEKPMFSKPYDKGRCLIPAGCYYEWLKDGAVKHKYAIGTEGPLYMAGLYRYEPGASLPSFVILTRAAAPGIAFIHERMPVIVPEHIRNKWLTTPITPKDLFEVSEANLLFREAV